LEADSDELANRLCHNGGVWPFICGFYVAACAPAGQIDLAERKLLALTDLVKPLQLSAI
jgi:hypothetical protein